MRVDIHEPATYVTAPCCFERPKSLGVMITARGPSVRNPNSYHHGTGIVQTFEVDRNGNRNHYHQCQNNGCARAKSRRDATTDCGCREKNNRSENDMRRWLWGNPLRDGQVGGIREDFHDDVHAHSDAHAHEAIAAPKRGPDHGRDRTTGLTPKPTRRGESRRGFGAKRVFLDQVA